MFENWKKYIFENSEKTLFETDNASELHDYLDELQEICDSLIFINLCESENFIMIYFEGYTLMIKK